MRAVVVHGAGELDVAPLVTHSSGLDDAGAAFAAAADRSTGSGTVVLDLT